MNVRDDRLKQDRSMPGFDQFWAKNLHVGVASPSNGGH
jgi:hypothetical protein